MMLIMFLIIFDAIPHALNAFAIVRVTAARDKLCQVAAYRAGEHDLAGMLGVMLRIRRHVVESHVVRECATYVGHPKRFQT